jgi:Cu+-exporting ATPase
MKPVPDMDRVSGNSLPPDKVVSAIIDPVCGMTVSPAGASGSHEYNGKTYYFCSTNCLLKFTEDPAGFLNKSVRPMAQPIAIEGEPKAATAPVAET